MVAPRCNDAATWATTVYDDGVAVPVGPTTEDYLWAIGDTRMTVSGEMVGQFLEDIDSLARL